MDERSATLRCHAGAFVRFGRPLSREASARQGLEHASRLVVDGVYGLDQIVFANFAAGRKVLHDR